MSQIILLITFNTTHLILEGCSFHKYDDVHKSKALKSILVECQNLLNKISQNKIEHEFVAKSSLKFILSVCPPMKF